MNDRIRRRSYLRGLTGVSAGGLAALAGCAGSDSENTEGDTSTSGGSEGGGEGTTSRSETQGEVDKSNWPLDATYNMAWSSVPSEMQWNIYNVKQRGHGPHSPTVHMFDDLWLPNPTTGEMLTGKGTVADSFSVDEEAMTATIELAEDKQWHNGDEYVAQDLVTQYKLNQVVNNRMNFAEEFTAVDDKTVEVSLSNIVNPDILFNANGALGLNPFAVVKESEYGQWVEQIEDATTEEETQSVIQELSQWRIEEPIGNGPFEYESASGQQLTLTHFEDYHASIPITEIVWKYLPSDQIPAAAISGQIDGGISPNFSESEWDQLPEDTLRFESGVPIGGWSFGPNLEREPFNNRHVRQAFAYILDRERLAENHPTHELLEHWSSLTSSRTMEWIGEDQVQNWENYGTTTKAEQAMAHLNEAGYQKNSEGTVVDSEGNPLSFTLLSPEWEQYLTPTLNTMMDDFGIEMEVQVQPDTQWANRRSSSDFDMTFFWWGERHPHGTFNFLYNEVASMYNVETTFDVPPMGEPTSDETMSVDVMELLDELYYTTEEEAAKEIVRTLSWATNQYLPQWEATMAGPLTAWQRTENWNVPSEDHQDFHVKHHYSWWFKKGLMYPKQ